MDDLIGFSKLTFNKLQISQNNYDWLTDIGVTGHQQENDHQQEKWSSFEPGFCSVKVLFFTVFNENIHF